MQFSDLKKRKTKIGKYLPVPGTKVSSVGLEGLSALFIPTMTDLCSVTQCPVTQTADRMRYKYYRLQFKLGCPFKVQENPG